MSKEFYKKVIEKGSVDTKSYRQKEIAEMNWMHYNKIRNDIEF